MFIFWELVGVSSYLLIGFWFERDPRGRRGEEGIHHESPRRLRVHARHPDGLGWRPGHVVFAEIAAAAGRASPPIRAISPTAALLIFCGAVGKSAQFPLHVWLPDAMEGPTPVSALIHAATMVAAGVYMLCRVFFLVGARRTRWTVIAWIGGITASSPR